MRKFLVSGATGIYMLSVLAFTVYFAGDIKASATDFGIMCINGAYPVAAIEYADSRDNEEVSETVKPADEEKEKEEKTEEPKKPVVFGDKPAVLILHTHATESYLPTSSGNYHSKKEKNTVRDVGNVLAKSLEAEGISVVHDKTLHDSPSYNNSYYRSYETAQALLKKYPTVKCVIDLHRDAISSKGSAATVKINGKVCSKYSYVIGTTASTYKQNKAFISNLNKVAKASYSGYTGKVIERGYTYNQNLSSKYLLLEVGYNRNQIEEARNSAHLFGKILADTLKKGY